jgi:hypothetical protein
MKYKGYTKTLTTEVSDNGAVISVSENISVNWKEMNKVNNISVQQQQQQSSKEDGPGGA